MKSSSPVGLTLSIPSTAPLARSKSPNRIEALALFNWVATVFEESRTQTGDDGCESGKTTVVQVERLNGSPVVPGTWAEAHHWNPWLTGGRTDLADGVLLCSHHHHRAHDPAYLAQRLPNGDVRFTRRT